MSHLPLAMILSEAATTRAVNSARPDAPVVPEPAPRSRRTRVALATLLERAAFTVAPSEWSPAR
jgi:D-alanyl-D-alanine dipeptidase